MSKPIDDPYSRLMRAVILRAVADQDPRNVVTKAVGGIFEEQAREKISEEAKEFVQSEEFTVWCRLTGLDPEELRSMEPRYAKKELGRLMKEHKGQPVKARRESEEKLDRSTRASNAIGEAYAE